MTCALCFDDFSVCWYDDIQLLSVLLLFFFKQKTAYEIVM